MVIPLCMHSAFPTERGEQTIVMLFNDVTRFASTPRRGVYKESAHEPEGCHLGFLELNISINC